MKYPLSENSLRNYFKEILFGFKQKEKYETKIKEQKETKKRNKNEEQNKIICINWQVM